MSKEFFKKRRYDDGKGRSIEGFSYQPDKLAVDEKGVNVSQRNAYLLMVSENEDGTFKECAYVPLENKYFTNPKFEIPKEMLEADFLPYLRWDFDDIKKIEETEEILDAKGKPKQVKTGRVVEVNMFPPSPENIAKKRAELLSEATEAGKMITQEELIQATLPRQLLCENFTNKGPSARRPRRY